MLSLPPSPSPTYHFPRQKLNRYQRMRVSPSWNNPNESPGFAILSPASWHWDHPYSFYLDEVVDMCRDGGVAIFGRSLWLCVSVIFVYLFWAEESWTRRGGRGWWAFCWGFFTWCFMYRVSFFLLALFSSFGLIFWGWDGCCFLRSIFCIFLISILLFGVP